MAHGPAESPPALRPRPLAVYVHWPFCAAKCPYCDFNSHVRHEAIDQDRFAGAYCREIETLAARLPGRVVTSVFFRGGTPSLMDPAVTGRVLDAIADRWTIAADVEVTLEANPSSVEADRFRGYHAAGVNRLSLGVQALVDADLRRLGRLHDAHAALAAIEIARATFPRLSFDLIYARPGQTPDAWRRELDAAIDRAADHLSLYQLTIEPDTPFEALHRAGALVIPDSDSAADLYEITQAVCGRRGLPAYEISNHARPGAECRHNLAYWRYEDYVGIGPGAHGRIDGEEGRRALSTEPHPETWLDQVERSGDGIVVDTALSDDEQADEFLLMGLRLTEGISPGAYEARAGRPLDRGALGDLLAEGLIERSDGDTIRATRSGRLLLNRVVSQLSAA